MIRTLTTVIMVLLGLLYFYMASVVITNTKSKYGYIYGGLFTSLSLWAIFDGFLTNSTDAVQATQFVVCIASTWIYTFAFLTHIVLILSDTYKDFNKTQKNFL